MILPAKPFKCFVFFLVFYLFLLSETIAQNIQKTDSLLEALRLSTQDIAKSEIYNLLASEYQNSNPDTARYFALKALRLSSALFPSKLADNKSGTKTADSLVNQQIANAFYILASIYNDKHDYDSSIHYYNKSLALRVSVNDLAGVAKVYNGLGLVYTDKGLYAEAVLMFKKSIEIKEKTGDKKGVANSYGNIGAVYEFQGNYAEALKMHFLALSIKKEIGFKRGIATSYSNVALIYMRQENYEEALKMDMEAIKLFEELNDKKRMTYTYSDIGTILKEMGDKKQALSYFLKALKIAEDLDNKYGIAGIYINIANLIRDKEPANAENYYLKSAEIMNVINNHNGELYALGNLGEFYKDQKMYAKARDCYEKTLLLAKKTNSNKVVQACYSGLSEIYAATNNYTKAYEYSQLLLQVNDSLMNNEKMRQINELTAIYETEKKQKEIEFLNRDKEQQDIKHLAELKYQAAIRNLFIAASVLLVIIIIVSFLSYRQKIRTNALLALKNEEISRQKAGIEGQEEERKRLAKELHDGLGGTLASIKLQMMQLSKNDAKQIENIMNQVSDACREVRTISHNLSPHAIANVPLTEVIHNLVQKYNTDESLKIKFECFPQNELNALSENIKTDVYRIVQELLNNIVKYAQATKVEIDLTKQENYLYLLVEDNGLGFDIQSIKKGIGLKNIESRVQLLNGELIIDSQPGRGTAVNVSIPV